MQEGGETRDSWVSKKRPEEVELNERLGQHNQANQIPKRTKSPSEHHTNEDQAPFTARNGRKEERR
jgi:hypothetical protein